MVFRTIMTCWEAWVRYATLDLARAASAVAMRHERVHLP
jgi:hypothetical protein